MQNLFVNKALPLQCNTLSILARRYSVFRGRYLENIPEFPKKSLFSSIISDPYSEQQRKELEKEFNITVNQSQAEKELRPFKKLSDFQLTRSDYSKINEDHPYGKVNIFKYKDTNFTLVGSQYEFLPTKNIYKILSHAKPSIIVLQARPDHILKSIELNPLNKEGKFSNRQYFSQLQHNAPSIMPSAEEREIVYNELLKQGILIDNVEEESPIKYKPYNLEERVSTRAASIASLYGESKEVDIILGDLPEEVFRQNIANNLTLLQLQNIFTHCARELALYPDLQPHTPLTMAYLLYPEIFLKPTDSYMCTLFEYMIHKGYKDIFALVGFNQSETIKEYLDKRRVSSLENELKVTEPKGTIIRDLQGEEVLEKHSILDIMLHGEDIMGKLENINFKTTYKMIQKHADPNHTDSSKFDQFRLLHFQFLVKYQQVLDGEYKKGKTLLKREFLSKSMSI